ncbi:unnamed protein product [Adineta ricciae]|uniref:Envelope fusion glycoprotein n=1 Tax=Adineta ricciae TaxID=249248 RepID=A0A815ZNQ1_ADIRI|nr:unnamed protein product [Adineta ricciae]CAF1586562.1 unnamed protein product [Adineta ricciae]
MSSPLSILLFIGMMLTTYTNGLIKFKLPKTDIIHPKSGLVMQYLSEFRPANKIITFTVTIPMYSDMCYLVPNVAMGKIPQCMEKEATMREIRAINVQLARNSSVVSLDNQTRPERAELNRTMLPLRSAKQEKPRIYPNRIVVGDQDTIYIQEVEQSVPSTSTRSTSVSIKTKPRAKRLIAEIIAIGAGIASTALSVVNLIQNMNLKSEMKHTKQLLRTLQLTTRDNHAQIIHTNEGQFKVVHELGATQTALNKTIDLVNQHSEVLRLHSAALKTVISQTMLLRDKLATATQAMESHFIHESMEDILVNKLNLYFVHHQDLPNVINLISQAMNISWGDFNTSIPTIEIITRLLVRQQIDFAPAVTKSSEANKNEIGKLMFTSYFAAPDQNQPPFSVYELFPIPFKFRNSRVLLAKMPAYIGIQQTSQQFIHWSHEEAKSCDFKIMPFCRESPPQRKEYEDDCLYQILSDSVLQHCRIEFFHDKVFIRQIGPYWAISTHNKNQCHYVSTEDLDQHSATDNEQITLPEMALIRADGSKILACDRFTIPKRPTNIGTPINLIYQEAIIPEDRTLINLQEALDNNTQWPKLPYISSELHAIIEFLNNTPATSTTSNTSVWENHPLSIVKITFIAILTLVVLVLIFCIFRFKKTMKSQNNLTITMPSMKQLLERED